jgi:hypothetical protein
MHFVQNPDISGGGITVVASSSSKIKRSACSSRLCVTSFVTDPPSFLICKMEMEMPSPLDHGKNGETKLEKGSILHGTQ